MLTSAINKASIIVILYFLAGGLLKSKSGALAAVAIFTTPQSITDIDLPTRCLATSINSIPLNSD